MSRFRPFFALAVAVAACGCVPAGASGSTTVGQTFTPTAACGSSPFTIIQSGVSSGNPYSVPADGVITSWNFQAGASVASDLALKVMRPIEPQMGQESPYLVVGESPAGLLTALAANVRSARIPVRAGDVIGISFTGGDCHAQTVSSADTTLGWGVTEVGTTHYLGYFEDESRLPVSAQVEPDSDRDGYGDETQDLCSGDAATQGTCPDRTPPETSIAKGPPKKTTKAKAAFVLASSEPGSTFECQLDGKFSFAACGASQVLKVSIGKHRLAVRATDAAGNVDPTPAIYRWKVVKKPRRHRHRHR